MKWMILTGFLVLLGHGEGYSDEGDSSSQIKSESLPKPPAQASNRTCIAKAMFVKECNICWCNDDGTDFFCTRKVCVPEPEDLPETPEEFRVIKKECRPFEVFELDCNMCRCNADGKSFSCTRRACLDLEDKVDGPAEVKFPLRRSIRAAPQDKPKACEPGEEFRMDCNKCLCDNEGFSFSCTRNDCAQASASVRARREVAGEGEVKKVEGGCEPGSSSPAGCPPHDKKILENGFRCNPGEQFKQDCNDCTCSADGRSTFCTVRLCDNALPQSIAP